MADWPAPGARVLVWSERPPSSTPRDPHEATVDHVAGRTFTVAGVDATFNRSTGRSKPVRHGAGRTFTVAGVDATFNRSTGRSKPVRHGAGAFASTTYVAVDAGSKRARDVVGSKERRDRDVEASRAVHAWLADRSRANRQAAIEALQALDDQR